MGGMLNFDVEPQAYLVPAVDENVLEYNGAPIFV